MRHVTLVSRCSSTRHKARVLWSQTDHEAIVIARRQIKLNFQTFWKPYLIRKILLKRTLKRSFSSSEGGSLCFSISYFWDSEFLFFSFLLLDGLSEVHQELLLFCTPQHYKPTRARRVYNNRFALV